MSVICAPESYAIMRGCLEVCQEKGAGFVESVCQECLEMEPGDQGIPFIAQPQLALTYKGRTLNSKFIANFGHSPKLEYERIAC